VAVVEVVLFDLGGVLIDFGGAGAMRELAGMETEDEVWRRWLACDWVRSFERGACTTDDFAAGVVADWALPLDPTAFLEAFSSWLGEALPGAEELVADVQRVVPVGCLSNTNPVHWELRDRWPFLDRLDHRFLSFELGLVKPDVELFERVAELLPVPARSVLVLDDNQVNVDGARAAGYQAHLAKGPDDARRVLEELEVL
jgi:FMN phosphatase YigB (HAD superfamily)